MLQRGMERVATSKTGTAWDKERGHLGERDLLGAVQIHYSFAGKPGPAWRQINEHLGLDVKSRACENHWLKKVSEVLTVEAKAAAVAKGMAAAKLRMEERDKDIERQRRAGAGWVEIAAKVGKLDGGDGCDTGNALSKY